MDRMSAKKTKSPIIPVASAAQAILDAEYARRLAEIQRAQQYNRAPRLFAAVNEWRRKHRLDELTVELPHERRFCANTGPPTFAGMTIIYITTDAIFVGSPIEVLP